MQTMPTAHVRPLTLADAGDVLAAFRSASDMSRQGDVTDEASAASYLAWACGKDSNTTSFAIEVDGRVAGCVGISVDAVNLVGWVWYWMHADYRGRGLTSRATTTVANWALTDGGLERLELGHRANNPASGRVALAAGFTWEGVERGKFLIDGERIDVRTYGRLKLDPPPTSETLDVETASWPSLIGQHREEP